MMAVGLDANRLVSYSGDAVSMYTHTGTHVDSLNRFGYHGRIFNNFSAQDHLGSRHWQVAGADKHPPVIARGLLLDVAGLHGVEMLPPSHGIGPNDLAACLRHQGSELRPGDVVMIRTGRMRAWPDPGAYMTNPPGLNRAGAGPSPRAARSPSAPTTTASSRRPRRTRAGRWSASVAEAGVPIMEITSTSEAAAGADHQFVLLRRLHQAARRHRRADAPGRDAARVTTRRPEDRARLRSRQDALCAQAPVHVAERRQGLLIVGEAERAALVMSVKHSIGRPRSASECHQRRAARRELGTRPSRSTSLTDGPRAGHLLDEGPWRGPG